jgi:hypothetical protein
MTENNRYCFETDKFEIINNEDVDTNPNIYGKELAQWIKKKLLNKGYPIEKILAEDWGWCIICYDKPFLLWVGCSGEYYDEKLIWSCFAEVEKPLFRNPFKKINTKEALYKLDSELFELLNKHFSLTPCP